MSRPILTQLDIKQLLEYDPITGNFKWLIRKKGISRKETGTSTTRGYKSIMINKFNYTCHRLAWVYINGEIPNGMQIDHINHDRSDNRIANLRLVTNQQNQMNKGTVLSNSGFIGVSWVKSRKRWESRIKLNGKNINLGRFIDLEDAISARLSAESFYWSEYI